MSFPLVPQRKHYRIERKTEKRLRQRRAVGARAKVRAIVFRRAHGRCERCQQPVSFDVAPYEDNHAEVNEPGLRSKGADPLDPNQCELLCHACHYGGPSHAHAPTAARMKARRS